MNSERAFATFRIAGDNLRPAQITELLRLRPTLSYAKGEEYERGPHKRKIVGRTGMWFFNTDEKLKSNRLEDHVAFLLHVIAAARERPLQLRHLIEQNSLHAAVTLFWAGPPGTKPPSPSKEVEILKHLIPIEVTTDFADDKEPTASDRQLAP
jgi:hypothetical protein